MRRNSATIETYSYKGFCFIPLQGVGIAVITFRMVLNTMPARDGVPESTAFKIDFFDGEEVDSVLAWGELAVDVER